MNLLVDAAYARDAARVAQLLSQGVDPNGRNEIGVSPLSAGARTGASDVVRLLLSAGADPNAESTESTPLHAGAGAGCVVDCPTGGPAAVVELLLAAGADPNQRTEDGSTPLYAGWSDAEVTRLLLEAGADPDAESIAAEDAGSGYSPLQYARKNDHHEVVRLLIDLGAIPT